jgi:hypothetical protein
LLRHLLPERALETGRLRLLERLLLEWTLHRGLLHWRDLLLHARLHRILKSVRLLVWLLHAIVLEPSRLRHHILLRVHPRILLAKSQLL